MKRLLLIAILLLTGSVFVFAQEGEGKAAEGKEGEGKKTEEVAEVWKWANFAILAVALGYIVMKTIPPAFKARGAEIQKGIAEARVIKEDADKRAAEVEAKIKTLAADIEKLRVESKAEMQAEGDRISKETAAQIARIEAQAQQDIDAAGKTAQRELKSYAAKLALELAEQRLQGRLDGNTEAGLVSGFVQDLGRLGSGSKN
ncbi:MAG: ATP synthase F0 subunit B [Bryobacteraceae bacterium]